MACSLEGSDQIASEFHDVVGAAVGQILLGELPDSLVWVEFRGVRREGLEVQTRIVPAQFPDRLSTVDSTIVPDDDDVAPEMSEKVSKKDADLILLDVLGMQVVVEPKAATARTDRHSGNGRDPIMTVTMPKNRRPASGGPGAAHARNQEEARFIDKDEVGTQPRGVFFTRTHSFFFQRAIFFSSRSRARRSGFWWLQ